MIKNRVKNHFYSRMNVRICETVDDAIEFEKAIKESGWKEVLSQIYKLYYLF